MATIVNNPGPDRIVEVDRTDSSGWAMAVLILVVVIAVGAYAWVHYRHAATPASGGTNINVTLPAGTTNSGASGPTY